MSGMGIVCCRRPALEDDDFPYVWTDRTAGPHAMSVAWICRRHSEPTVYVAYMRSSDSFAKEISHHQQVDTAIKKLLAAAKLSGLLLLLDRQANLL